MQRQSLDIFSMIITISILILLFNVRPLWSALIFAGTFLLLDIYLCRLYKQFNTNRHIITVVSLMLISYFISAGIPLTSYTFYMRIAVNLVVHIIQMAHDYGYTTDSYTNNLTAMYSPLLQSPAFVVGSAATLLASIDFWICVGFLFVWLSMRIKWKNGREILISCVLFYLLFGVLTAPFNVRKIRLIDSSVQLNDHRMTIQEQAYEWLKERRANIEASKP
jgi:hypothetical protein